MKNFSRKIDTRNMEIKKIFDNHKSIVLFGYNEIARYFLEKEISKICAVDEKLINNLKNQNIDKKIKFKTLEQISRASIIINCVTGIKVWQVNLKLKNLGFHSFSWIEVKNAFDYRDFDYWYLVNFDKFFFKNFTKFETTFKKLSDWKSKKEFLKILSYKVCGSEKTLKFNTENSNNQYFTNFINIDKNSTIIDVGAYDGDTIKSILSWKKEFKKIIAFEPEKENFKKLKKTIRNNKKITAYNLALGSISKMVFFNSSKDTSRITQDGDLKIEINTLDSFGFTPNFIKVDIEGGEKDFIIGSRETIKKCKPQLAICVYHRSDDFFSLVDLILKINSKYKLYFRHHSFGFTESVMYFI